MIVLIGLVKDKVLGKEVHRAQPGASGVQLRMALQLRSI